ncbi:MAG: hypothetical protein JSU98_16905 [Gemmatimonadales bacterium]|jgi:hypothetical protein|nr:MAG: hypothetical protein JSU98_16905 [Gemmatimonadales bacterium]
MSLNLRAVRVRLRNNRVLTGRIHITEGQSLSTFLSTKLHFLNMTGVKWVGAEGEEELPHLSVRLEQIIWVEPLETELHLSSAALPSEEARKIELQVDGGDQWHRLQVEMNVARETRMSDYLDANPGFIPLWSVRLAGGDETVDRVALNHRALAVIRELEDTDPRKRGY